jgi:FMN phosphatase YigB (HAD superfamily)
MVEPRRIDIVFFDVGGTLLDTRELDRWCDAATRLGIPLDPDHVAHAYEEVKRTTDVPSPRVTFEEFWRQVLEQGSGATVTLGIAERFVREIHDGREELPLFSDARRCLDEIYALGLRCGIISNSRSEATLRGLLGRAGILRGLDPILSSGTEGVEKPSAELFRRAAERARVPPERAFYVGDLAYTDAKAAAAAGFHSAWLNREGTGFGDDPPELTSLTELPGHLQLAGLVPPMVPVK